MSARRLLNMVQGFIVEGLDEKEREEFYASLRGVDPVVQKRRDFVLLLGGEFG